MATAIILIRWQPGYQAAEMGQIRENDTVLLLQAPQSAPLQQQIRNTFCSYFLDTNQSNQGANMAQEQEGRRGTGGMDERTREEISRKGGETRAGQGQQGHERGGQESHKKTG